MINDDLNLTGALTISLNDEVVQETKNKVVLSGKKWVASRMAGVTSDEMSHMAIGTSSTDPQDELKTTLVSELDRNGLSSTTVTDNAIQYTSSWGAGDGTGAIIEAGIFNDATGGDMLARTVFDSGVVNKGSADSMTITWTITVS